MAQLEASESLPCSSRRPGGAHVVGTASGRNQSFLRELGVDEPIDYATTEFEDVARDIDVVFDTQGSDTQQRS